MKSRFPHAAAALLAAGALPFALAQQLTDSRANPPFVEEPVASTSVPDPSQAGTAGAIMNALNADPSMKGAKITVQPDEGGKVLLTGVTQTVAQRIQASKAATAHAGEGNVANAIQTEEVLIYVPDPVDASLADSAATLESPESSTGGSNGGQDRKEGSGMDGRPRSS